MAIGEKNTPLPSAFPRPPPKVGAPLSPLSAASPATLLSLIRASGHSHSHLPSPTADASEWADFTLAFPGRWSSAVSGLHFVDSCCDAAAVAKVSTVGGTRPHACTICDDRFASAKALSQHMRMQHGRKCLQRLLVTSGPLASLAAPFLGAVFVSCHICAIRAGPSAGATCAACCFDAASRGIWRGADKGGHVSQIFGFWAHWPSPSQ